MDKSIPPQQPPLLQAALPPPLPLSNPYNKQSQVLQKNRKAMQTTEKNF